ncbi:MAG TPA: hypothetical protein VJT73_20220 [Polyangiaceae bacterium]|nr:hypothetical protein [Polyangiaceae bacterium]
MKLTLMTLGSMLALIACGGDASLGKSDSPVEMASGTGSGTTASGSTSGTGTTGSGATGAGTTSSGTTTGSGSTGAGGSGGSGGSSGQGGSNAEDASTPRSDAGADPCATVRCAAGTHCALEEVVCIQAPCLPQPVCLKDGASCKVDKDCRLVDNYCGGCTCDALGATQTPPACNKGIVQCLRAPCQGKTAHCSFGSCVAQ